MCIAALSRKKYAENPIFGSAHECRSSASEIPAKSRSKAKDWTVSFTFLYATLKMYFSDIGWLYFSTQPFAEPIRWAKPKAER